MYLWVVLTTFLAMIAAFFLPIREDTQNMVTVPVAQARMMHMLIKHKAGKRYLMEKAYPFFSTEPLRKVDYISGRIDNLAGFNERLPHGFVNDSNYVSVIYCMKNDLSSIQTGTDSCWRTEANKIKRMLITYGMIPERWQSIFPEGGGSYDIKPSPDMIKAFREHFATGEKAGYVISEGGKMYIVNFEGTKFEIPAVIAADSTVAGGYGIKNCLSDYKSCLAYMSWQ